MPTTRSEVQRFAFAFDPRFRALLFAVGVTPRSTRVSITPDRLVARFGPWKCATELSNVRETCLTGPYQWFKVIGARGSLVDRGLTFGTTTTGGVCVLFDKPVPGLDPFGAMRHPGLTVTVADREGFAAALRDRAGIS